jgi:Zn-dependent protease
VQQRNVIGALIGFVSYAILILIHEAGHAVIAMRRGMDVLGIYLYPLHGRCDHQASEYEVDEIWVAWGGIIAQALLFVTVFFIAGILGAYSGGLRLLLEPMLMVFISLNALMIITNLMPMTSLDGDTAWRVLPRFWYNFVIPSLRHHVARLKRRKTTKKISEQDASLIAEDVLKKIMGKEQR